MSLSFADGLFWLSVACCAVAQIFIIRSVQLGRHRVEPSVVASRSRHGVELLWAYLPAIALVVLLAFTWKAVRANEQAPPQPIRTLPAGA
jgi:heme/copper-type cytochrome/quinol oxidase subunit 2